VLCVLLCAIGASAMWGDLENPQGYEYEQYLVDFGKSYEDPAEYAAHKAVFEVKKAQVLAHNADRTQTWTMGINKFSDMTQSEFSRFLGLNKGMTQTMKSGRPLAELPNVPLSSLPDSVDWRKNGVVSAVKDQGGCGSCWAFAAVECIESTLTQASQKKLILSPQNMVSCTKNPQHCGGTGGCAGATSELGYDYVAKTGIASEKDYPYRAVTGTCDESKPKSAHIKSFVQLPENNYTALVTAIATVGPIAVSVDANSWGGYSRGVFNGCSFNRVDINHAVQLVGYGTDAGKDYWIVRNSWGGFWGESGYIRMLKHSDGDMKWCGPDHNPQDGTGCDGGPPVVTCCGTCGIWYDSSYPVGATLVE